MRVYSVGLEKVRVYEAWEDRPEDSVAVEADGDVVCYVGRVTTFDAERCMAEAAQRHVRLKMIHRPEEGPLRFPKVKLRVGGNRDAREVLEVSLLKRAPRPRPAARPHRLF